MNKSISRSHTIQRAGPLSALADEGHVLTPRWSPDGITLKLVGLNEASTFAGFCREHEMIFDTFESTGVIESDEDFDLQIFRSLCREIARQEHNIATAQRGRDVLAAKLDTEIRAEAKRLNVEMASYRSEGGALGVLDDHIGSGRDTLQWLEAAYDDIFPAVTRTGTSRLIGMAVQIKFPLPVALSGLGYFDYEGKSTGTLVGVIPQPAGSLIYMIGRSGSENAIGAVMRNKELDLCLLEIVEAWMVRGTDHWFLTPSVWNVIPPDRQALLLAEMRETALGVSYPPSTSIFDDLRRAALAIPTNSQMTASLKAYVASQHAKLAGPA